MSSGGDWFEREQLHDAAREGDLERVKSFLAHGDDINAFDDTSRTPLHHAIENENLIVAQFLLESGADVNAHEEAKSGDTPLGTIATHCSLAAARILIEAGANPTIPGWMGITPLDRVKQRTDPEGSAVQDLLARATKR
jgi:ankyrin repeat protein